MSGIVKVIDKKYNTEFEVEQSFVDKVLDFKSSLKGRKPTRKELADLLVKLPDGLEDEIQQMFKRYYYHECKRGS